MMYINGIEITKNLDESIISFESFTLIKNSGGVITPMRAILGKYCPSEMNLNPNGLYVFRRTMKGGLIPLKVGFDYSAATNAFPPKMTNDQKDVEQELRRLGI